MLGSLFNKSSFGLDAGDGSIKFVELIDTKDGVRLGRHGEYKVHNKRELKETFSALKKIFGSKPVHLSLGYQDKEKIKEHILTLKNFGIKTKSSEHRTHAIGRSVIKKGDFGTYMLVNHGKEKSDIFIFSGGALVYHIPASASVYFLRDEIAKRFLHWHIKKGEEWENIRLPIKKIIVCGNAPNLAEFVEHLALHLRHRVETGNVWVNILDTSEHIPEIILEESFDYASALGAALKEF
ncbi:TPA: hypothetical protein DEQ22_02210 [Candidatus Nomurabacteria bacterium]|uniref:Actin-like protein N-terminal domain-containing protein n=2 Tax=Candidatus Nomuraibacteriota TaxID=1752729 RepID=A0A1F6YQ16_9BACT|nr:MAG: Type IV pilus assembly protein PilM [Parcubacteria group bacterium GW2011_GWC1_42_21]KKS58099.1 MAG: Type IV pilus assembly protein PilM [Candidatus Nomurabacteria bacterium GW2011_GWF1_42_40]KKS99518.1 MAG: Type IV pilus assembly protein PilM [Candidatus Nomurabacteria bacterium GW2011_GWA1_43_17]KKT06354.1 MAG: Type IV pilus assembly protein PilM [Candidatus Nomurabacteria bacterium GW2011_GWB1_43_19]KKT10544.1 MAG: Type IV pilus assembly protein PilM [Candidatus Nomurabacteria bacter